MSILDNLTYYSYGQRFNLLIGVDHGLKGWIEADQANSAFVLYQLFTRRGVAIDLNDNNIAALGIGLGVNNNNIVLGDAAAGNMVVFGGKIENAGYYCGVYSGEYYYNRNLPNVTRYTKWIARYGSNTGKPGTKPNVQNVVIWQYSSKGRVSGINGNVDVNIMYGEDLLKAVTGKDYIQAARDVWAGKYGANDERIKKLTEEGFDPRIVQHFVNRLKK